jgi:hypothetical protein
MVTLYDVLEFLIQKGPGRTEAELAKAIFGEKGYPQLVNSDCRRLMHGHKVVRQGTGRSDPYRYYPAENA